MSTSGPTGYDLSGSPPEVVSGLVTLGALVSALSQISAEVAQPQYWHIATIALHLILPNHRFVLTPLAVGGTVCSVKFDEMVLPDELVALYFAIPICRRAFATVVAAYIDGHDSIAQFPLPPQITFAGTSADWMAVA